MSTTPQATRKAFEACILAVLNLIDSELTDKQRDLAYQIYEACNQFEYTLDEEQS